MIRPLMTTVLAFAGIATSTATAQTTRTVCASGCDHTSINVAIDASSNGDIIQLSAETYIEGVAIDTKGKEITLLGTTDTDGNPNSILDGGGAHRVVECTKNETRDTVFENLVIQNGLATGDFSKGHGGGMYNKGGSSPTINNCSFKDNSAASGGGLSNDDGCNPILTKCTFTSNSATDRGGGISNKKSDCAMFNCQFTRNTCKPGVGGGIFSTESSLTLNGCTFSNNTSVMGGGVYNSEGSLDMAECTFTSNTANSGGAVKNISSSMNLTGCGFHENSSGSGGAINFDKNSSGNLAGCKLHGNSVDSISFGGAVIIDGGSDLALVDCVLMNNQGGSGGAIMVNDGKLSMTRCMLKYNESVNGGGLFISGDQAAYDGTGGSATLDECTFRMNGASGYYGGGIFNQNELVMSNCTLTGNYSAKGGGGIGNNAAALEIEGCTFIGNKSEIGGGMFNRLSSPIIRSCTFTENMAESSGGGMNTEGGMPTLIACTLQNNRPDDLSGPIESATFNTCIPGDLDGDGDYDADDIRIGMVEFGISESKPDDMGADASQPTSDNDTLVLCAADINDDGMVDGADLSCILGWWGLCSAP